MNSIICPIHKTEWNPHRYCICPFCFKEKRLISPKEMELNKQLMAATTEIEANRLIAKYTPRKKALLL